MWLKSSFVYLFVCVFVSDLIYIYKKTHTIWFQSPYKYRMWFRLPVCRLVFPMGECFSRKKKKCSHTVGSGGTVSFIAPECCCDVSGHKPFLRQWCKVTKYIYLSTVLKYIFEEFVLEYFQMSVLVLLLHYISERNIVLLLHYIHFKTLVTSYFADIH